MGKCEIPFLVLIINLSILQSYSELPRIYILGVYLFDRWKDKNASSWLNIIIWGRMLSSYILNYFLAYLDIARSHERVGKNRSSNEVIMNEIETNEDRGKIVILPWIWNAPDLLELCLSVEKPRGGCGLKWGGIANQKWKKRKGDS